MHDTPGTAETADTRTKCSSCGSRWEATAAFCADCGSPLALRCGRCGLQNAPDAQSCGDCGQSLTRAVPAPPAPPPTNDRPAAAPASFAAGRYHVREFLAEGGRKRVFIAHDTRLDRDVVVAMIKTEGLDASGRSRVQQEARVMARLGDDPHIVTVYDTGEEEGRLYIVSQYMTGGDLETLLDGTEEHRLPLDQALGIATDVCHALEHAHKHGIVHRDLKPGNVWLAGDGTARLGDFGLAASDRDAASNGGGMVGTVAYMPPEQALGRAPDRRNDLYSLGALLYEMTTGRPPFVGDDAVAVVTQHMNSLPVAPSVYNPEIPAALDGLILHLLAKTPAERPDCAEEVRTSLARIRDAGNENEEPTPAPSNPLDRLATGVFVGRAREADVLRTAFDDVLSGHGRLVLLVGEPGIGKTRLAEELITYARLRNAEVLSGRCYETEGAPAYWPWVQIIRTYVDQHDGEELIQIMGAGAADIAQVVSAVRDKLPELPAPPPLEPEKARFRLFDSITDTLKSAAARRPMVLFLDDLHWADKPSLLLLLFIARELHDCHLLILAAYRDVELGRHHPLSRVVAELVREQLSQRVLLRGLTEGDVGRFIEITAGKPQPRELVTAVSRQTEGNPFFVKEVVRLLVSEGQLEQNADVSPPELVIPQGVREVIGRRLDRLSPECNEVLSLASVIGREFGVNVLERVRASTLNMLERVREHGVVVLDRVRETGLNVPERFGELFRDHLLEALDEAIAARIINEVPHAPGQYTFSHALIRETLYSELPTTRRIRLHRVVGEVLERLYESTLELHIAELAHHFYEAAPGGNVAKAVDYAAWAGERATTLLAYEEAAGHYERALQAMELLEQVDARQRCGLLLSLGEAQAKAGDTARAHVTFQEAGKLAKRLGESEQLAHAALGMGGGSLTAGGVNRALIALLEDALDLLPVADSPLRARVMARLAIEVYWSEARQRGVRLSQDALAMAKLFDDPVALADAIAARHIALWRPEEVEDLLAGGTEIVRLARAADDLDRMLLGHAWRAHAFLTLGDLAGVDREMRVAARLADELRQPIYRWVLLNWDAMLGLLQGRFEEAERRAREALAIGQRVEPEDAPQAFAVQMLILRREQGRLDDLESAVKHFGRRYPTLPAWRCGLAYLYCHSGRKEEARREFEALAARNFTDLPGDMFWPIAVVLLAEVCVALEDLARADILYERLMPYARRNVVAGAGIVCLGSASRSLGELATLLGRWDEATRHFDDALAMHEKMGAKPFVVHTQDAYAHLLLRRDGPGDAERARTMITQALSTAHSLGMKHTVEALTVLQLQGQGLESADQRTSIDSVVSVVRRERPDLLQRLPPDEAVTILFSDIQGFARMTERLGDRRMQDVLRMHNAIIRRRLTAHDGIEVKSSGDGFMLAFADVGQALACAVAVQRDLATYNGKHPDTPVHVRMGLHTGETIREADDFFGKNVILAARIADQAAGGEILVSDRVRDAAGGQRFGARREVALKGLSDRYAISSVEWAG